MTGNRISIDISAADIAAINAAVETLQTKLAPHLIALEAGGKQSLSKMKDKSVPFVEKTLQYMETNPEFMPAYIDKAEADKDYRGFNVLNSLARPLTQIISNLEDTAVLCGSEVYQSTRAYYAMVRQATKMNVPNAKAVYEDLKVRFEAQGMKIVSSRAHSQKAAETKEVG